MTEYFGREFSHLTSHHLRELQDLETEGCVYTKLWRDEVESFGFCRIQLTPDEIVKYVDSLYGYDEFLGYRHRDYSAEEALEMVSNERVKQEAKRYAEWAKDEGNANPYCPAAFFLDHLEQLLCGEYLIGMNSCKKLIQETEDSC